VHGQCRVDDAIAGRVAFAPQRMLSVLLDEPLYAVDLISPEPLTTLQSNGIEPEFSCIIRTFGMNMGWFLAITCIKEESVGTDLQHS
jgi:hypothetical protein